MNRRKFLKALFCIPLLAVMPKMADEKKWIFNVPKYNEATKEIIHPEGFIWPTRDSLKWSHNKFFHPNEGLCEFVDIQTSVIIPKNRMILTCKNDTKGRLTWISNDDGLTWETLNGTKLPKPTA